MINFSFFEQYFILNYFLYCAAQNVIRIHFISLLTENLEAKRKCTLCNPHFLIQYEKITVFKDQKCGGMINNDTEVLQIFNIAICMFWYAEHLDSLSSSSLTYTSWMSAERMQLKSNKLRKYWADTVLSSQFAQSVQ